MPFLSTYVPTYTWLNPKRHVSVKATRYLTVVMTTEVINNDYFVSVICFTEVQTSTSEESVCVITS